MNLGQLIYDVARLYVLALILVGVFTILWLLRPSLVTTPNVAGIWFAVGGFGVLVILTILLVQYSRT